MRISRLALIALLLAVSPAAAQWQVPNNAIPVGRGPGVIGFNSAAGSGGAGNFCLLDTTPPAFANCKLPPLASGSIWIGSVGNVATAQVPSNDCTITVAGVITCTKSNGAFTVNGNLTVGGTIIDNVNGITLNSPTGGAKGAGTINISADYYKNNVIIPETVSAPLSLSAGGVVSCPTCVLISGTGRGDAAYTILSTDRYVYTNAAFTAPRTWTLPAANSLTAGTTIWVQDARGTVTTTNTLTITRGGADTIDLVNTSLVITGAGGGITFTTDGVSNWGTPIQTVSTGGTGRQTLTNHGLLVGAAANPVTQLAVGPTGSVLIGASGADPVFTAGAGQVPGTTTNDSATAGNAGEYAVCSGSNSAVTVTITIATPGVVTDTAHTKTGNSPVVFSTTGALPTGITAGTVYYVVGSSIGANTYQIATSIANAIAGTSVNTSGTQSGVQTVTNSVSLTTATTANTCGLGLTAGDWDLFGQNYVQPSGTTNMTYYYSSITTTSATADLTVGRWNGTNLQSAGQTGAQLPVTPNNQVGPTRLSIASTTTVYFVVNAAFTVSTNVAFGILRARRVR